MRYLLCAQPLLGRLQLPAGMLDIAQLHVNMVLTGLRR